MTISHLPIQASCWKINLSARKSTWFQMSGWVLRFSLNTKCYYWCGRLARSIKYRYPPFDPSGSLLSVGNAAKAAGGLRGQRAKTMYSTLSQQWTLMSWGWWIHWGRVDPQPVIRVKPTWHIHKKSSSQIYKQWKSDLEHFLGMFHVWQLRIKLLKCLQWQSMGIPFCPIF